MRNKTRTHQQGDTTGRTEQPTGRHRWRWKNPEQRQSNMDEGRGRQNALTKTRPWLYTDKTNEGKEQMERGGKQTVEGRNGQTLGVKTTGGTTNTWGWNPNSTPQGTAIGCPNEAWRVAGVCRRANVKSWGDTGKGWDPLEAGGKGWTSNRWTGTGLC